MCLRFQYISIEFECWNSRTQTSSLWHHTRMHSCLCLTCNQTYITCDCWGNEVKNRSGVAGSGCGFSEWRDPEARSAWYYPGASCPTGLGQGMWRVWLRDGAVEGQWKPRAMIHPAPQDPLDEKLEHSLQLPHSYHQALNLNQIPLWFVLQPWTTVSLQNLSMAIRLLQASTFTFSSNVIYLFFIFLIYLIALFLKLNCSLCLIGFSTKFCFPGLNFYFNTHSCLL